MNKELAKEGKITMREIIKKIKMPESTKHSYKYDILHEIGHLICGISCCREHAEFEAHGSAKALAFLLEIDIGDAEERMSCYAGRSSHSACGRMKKIIPTKTRSQRKTKTIPSKARSQGKKKTIPSKARSQGKANLDTRTKACYLGHCI